MTAQNREVADAGNVTGDSGESDGPDVELPIETVPALKPTIIWLWITILAGAAIVLYLDNNPQLLTGREASNTAIQVVIAVTAILVARLVIRIFVLTRTKYTVDDDTVRRRFELLYRTREREIPLAKVRSHEINQTAVQRLLGFGTISLNKGLGELELENIPNPGDVHHTISRILEEINS